ncbi:unnamed protein product [Rotaria sordida]|uniref:Protein-L-isoaspartate O-methyltransferase n=1 Tax=Rotaria sordida TaxID=392033 RepID=A0A815AWD5_9BILA|nr:unnamed protein product [Rotaria sordida]CAF4052448.1 unnamed protein product [Rotaria sordida]
MFSRLFYSSIFPFAIAIFVIFYRSSSLTALSQHLSWRSSSSTHQELIGNLYKDGIIQDKRIIDAMLKVDRADFTDKKSDTYSDRPQYIGYSVTISAPHMHGFALQTLKDHLQPGAKVLDIGSGSGYLTACMAYLVRPNGKAIGIEHIQELVNKSIKNIKKHNKKLFDDGLLEIHKGDGRRGYPIQAPYDAIHVGAAIYGTPYELIRQLKVGGRLVAPIGNYFNQEMITYDKKADGTYNEQRHMNVMYVPLTDEKSQYAKAGGRRQI